MAVCVCVCVRHHHSTVDSYLCVYVCVGMYANIAECLQLQKAVILLLIMKYFVLKMISYFHTTAPCNLLSSLRKKQVKRFHMICQLSSYHQ